RWLLAFAQKCAEAPTQTRLRFPRNLPDTPRGSCHLHLLLPAYTCRMAIGPCCFDQNAPGATIARLGDAATVDFVARRAFRGYEPKVPHQLARILEAGEITDLGQRSDGGNEIDAAHRLEGRNHLRERPLRHCLADRLF